MPHGCAKWQAVALVSLAASGARLDPMRTLRDR
jgi:hypothetical protein